MSVTIRNAMAGDNAKIRPLQEQIARLHYEGRPDLFRQEARYYSDEAFTDRLQKPDHFVFIAENGDGRVVGYAFANVILYRNHFTYRDFNSFYIDDICVLEEYRRQGIGRMLFDCCLRQAESEGCHNIDLGVYAFNSDAIAFYRRCGMGERTLRMELRLGE